MLTNRRLTAAEAAGLGIVTHLVEDGRLDAQVDELVASLSAGPTVAYGAVKRLLRSSYGASLTAQLSGEADSIAALGQAADGREGVAAFLAKRAPEFSG